MKNRASFLRKFFFVVILAFSFASPINGQDSALYYWNDIVQKPEMDEVELIQFAQQADIELLMLEHVAEVCQQFQPEAEESAEKLKNRIFDIGKNVREFLSKYTEEDIKALGATINKMFQENYELQKVEMPKVFSENGEDFQKNVCSEFRTGVLSIPIPVKVKRFK